MSETTERLSLPMLLAGQAQKHVTHNEALTLLDGLVQLAFHEDVATPPEEVTDQAYLVPSGATGAWSGQVGRIAVASEAGWRYLEPRAGWRAWSITRDEPRVFDGEAWVALTRQVERLGINAESTGPARLAVASDDIALAPSNTASDLRLKLNAEAERSAALSFEAGWSGRFELARGSDGDLRLKSSANGTDWIEVWRVDADVTP